MKLDCEVIRDLLPLYHDVVCSEKSRNLVEQHLSACEECREYLKNLDAELELGDGKEAVKPLTSIHRRLNRMRVAAFGVGLILAVVLSFGAWWGLTRYSFIPLKPDEYTAVAYQYQDGEIGVATSSMYRDYFASLVYVPEENAIYETLTRTILAPKHEMDSKEKVLSGYFSGGSVAFSPDDPDAFGIIPGKESGVIDAYYIGVPGSKDAVLMWKRGMELPEASAERE